MKIKNWFILAGGSATRWQGYQGENGYLLSLDLSDLDIEKIFNDIPRFQAEPEDIDPNWQKLLNGEL